MAQYVSPRPGIEVSGQSLRGYLDVTGRIAFITSRILGRRGIDKIVPESWYPLEVALEMFREIDQMVGEYTLFAIGRQIPENVPLPPGITTIEDALGALDVMYHLNHRLGGQVMFDLKTSRMIEGIGHYQFRVVGSRRGIMVCDNPYPSDFDRGIITGLSRKLKPAAQVVQDDTHPSRKKGGDSCTYIITW